ncbi:MAG: N-acetylmuramoyl-L-alanine amidase [Armatimonadota bacterium]
MQYTKLLKISTIIFFILTLACVCTAAPDTATLVIGGEKVADTSSPVIIDSKVFIPLDALKMLGASAEKQGRRKGDEQKVGVTRWDGKKVTCRAMYVGDNLMLPLSDVAEDIGAVTNWDEKNKSVSIRAQVEQIDFDGSQIKISTSYPVNYKVDWWSAQNKLIIQMFGAAFPYKDSDLTMSNTSPASIRLGSEDQTARIVLDMPNKIKHKVVSASHSSIISVSVSGLKSASELPGDIVTKPADIRPEISVTPPVQDIQPADPVKPVQPVQLPPAIVNDISFFKDGEHKINVTVSSDSPVKYLAYMFRQPDRLVIDFANSTLDNSIKDKQLDNDILRAVKVEQQNQGCVRVTLDLARVVSYNITTDSAQCKLTIALDMPRGAGGSLADKVIVIDPGHGGSKPGAKACNGMREKDITLAIAQQLQTLLKDKGVCVLLTRESDTELDSNITVDLKKRVEYAARNSADLFVSIHCNAVSAVKKISGTETYYHGRDANGRALAECIHPELLKATGFPDRKIKSDFSRYSTGFAVLRNASENYNIPAILIETGFIDHSYDARIVCDPEYQKSIAESILKGLRTYIEGNSSRNNSSVKRAKLDKTLYVKADLIDKTKTSNTTKQTTKSSGPKRPGEGTP